MKTKIKRKEMINFLKNHFRYYTMNSWNRSTSYAVNLKVWKVIPKNLQDRALELIKQGDIYKAIGDLIRKFNEYYQYRYQAAFNGRSEGYLVLYQGDLDYKNGRTAKCNICGKLTYHREDIPCTNQGCPGTLEVLDKPIPMIVTFPGKGMDMENEFEEWTNEELIQRVNLVKSFDKLAQDIIKLTIKWCKKFKVTETTVLAPKTIQVLAKA